ncbi:hypothetical protein [uncultured Hyphomonas sp.]|uniref:hypothetical protein n=1 Tax=uncultured Hyphomonas sp. TaxID=225298 RepID=UPI002AAC1D85|nr:hypothetical protein [uncultured Hyphomonas sp.]
MFNWSEARAVPVEDARLDIDERELIQANWILGAVNCVVTGSSDRDRKQVQLTWEFAQGFYVSGPESNNLGELKLGIFPTRNLAWKIENSPWVKQWAEAEPVFETWKNETNHWALFTEQASVHLIAVSAPVIMEHV